MDFEPPGLRDIRVPEEQALAVLRAIIFFNVVRAFWKQVGLGLQGKVNGASVTEDTEYGVFLGAKSSKFHLYAPLL